MKMIVPTQITDAMLVSSTVPETPPAAWNSGTTYGLGDTCSTGTAGGVIYVWVSLQPYNLNRNPTSNPIWWAQAGVTYSAWDSGVTYAAGDIVLVASTHRRYQSVQAANLNHNPVTDNGTWWVDIGPTNRWAMFDRAVGSNTEQASPLSVVLSPGLATALALLDISAESVHVLITHGAQTLFDQTHAMADGRVTGGWWGYFFEPLSPQTVLIMTDLPPVDGQITVELSSTGTARCGTLAVGRQIDLGETLSRPRIGITDYSRKTTDAFGTTTVVERGYAKRVESQFLFDNARLDYVANELAAVRATPCVYVAGNNLNKSSLIAYGFYRDWGIDVAYATHSEASITIEGLT